MSRRRPGVGVERPVDDFGDQVRRRVEHVLVRCPGAAFSGACHHGIGFSSTR